jgi:acyl-CoA thioesterase-1
MIFSRTIIILFLMIGFSFCNVNPVFANGTLKTILVVGDSLVAGYNIPVEQAFPAQLERKLRRQNYPVKVINAGVTGDTTSGGLTRLEWVLQQNPDYVILELGANDMLRVVPPAVTKENLRKMLAILKARRIPVLLAGMKATPNLGVEYGAQYAALYRDLAKQYPVVFYPFFLEGVTGHAEYLQDDGLHPTQTGVAVMVKNIFPEVKKLLTK